MPGNCLVIPRISRTIGLASVTGGRFYGPRDAKGAGRDPPLSDASSRRGPLERRRHLQLAGDDPGLELVRHRDRRLRHGRVDPAETDAAVLEVEVRVVARMCKERAGLLLLGDRVDARIDALECA